MEICINEFVRIENGPIRKIIKINEGKEKTVLAENYSEWTDDGIIANEDIKSIVTKQQFSSLEYII